MVFRLMDGQYEISSLDQQVDKSICIDTSKFYHIYNNNDKLNIIHEKGSISTTPKKQLYALIEIVTNLKAFNIEHIKHKLNIDVHPIQKGNKHYLVVNRDHMIDLCILLGFNHHKKGLIN